MWSKKNWKLPTSVGWRGCTHHIHSNLLNCNHTAPYSIRLQWVHGYLIIKYFSSTCQLCLAHTDITTSAYIYGHRKSWRYKDPSSITYLRLSKGDFIARMMILLRSILGIKGRFIPHKECQDSGVNVISWYSPSIISMYKKKSGLLVQNHLQSFANNLPNTFTNGVIHFSVLLCQKQWRYHFQNHSTPK